MSDAEATTKGTILRSLLKFVAGDLSPAQYGRALAALSPADRQIVEQGSILPTQKISEFTLNRLTVEAARAKGESLESFGRRAGRAEMADSVGVYRFLTFVHTLERGSQPWAAHRRGRVQELRACEADRVSLRGGALRTAFGLVRESRRHDRRQERPGHTRCLHGPWCGRVPMAIDVVSGAFTDMDADVL